MSELKLEAGKRYVRRDGTVTPELIQDGVFLRDYERDLMFMEDNPFMFNWTQPKPSDLISEYKEETSKIKREFVLCEIINSYSDVDDANKELLTQIVRNPKSVFKVFYKEDVHTGASILEKFEELQEEEVIDGELFDLETFYAKRGAIELALKIAAKKSGNVSEMLSGAGKILQFIEDNMPSK